MDSIFYQKFFKLSNDIFCIADTNGVILDVNARYLNITGFNEDEVKGVNFFEFIHPEDLNGTIEQIKLLEQGETIIKFTNRIKCKNGLFKWMEWSSTPDSETNRIFSSAREITEEVEAKQQLKKTILELERSNLDLEQFAYISSHDLQEPLRMISNFSNLFIEQYGSALDDMGRTYMKFITESSERMKNLITSLLEFSRVGRTELKFECTNLNQVVKVQLQNLKLLIEEKNVTISVKNLPNNVFVDKIQIGMLMYNLLNNAIKYNLSEKPVIEINATANNDKWEIYVADNGIGIDPKFREKIFMPYQRLHNKDEFEGTGIGLALCEKIINRHGGKIWVSNSNKWSSIFTFTLSK